MSVAEALRAVPLFAHLKDDDLERIAQVARERSYPKNSVIVFEDDPGDTLFVVLKGQVKVVLVGEDGREVILSTMTGNDFFGEMALIDDEPRSAHVIAMEDSELLVVRREDFQNQLTESPKIAVGLVRALTKRLRKADNKIGSLVLLDVTGRVARLLLDAADEEGGERITRKLTHHMIAQMIGSSRETVSRTMRALQDKEYIEVSKTAITIVDRPALLKACGRG